MVERTYLLDGKDPKVGQGQLVSELGGEGEAEDSRLAHQAANQEVEGAHPDGGGVRAPEAAEPRSLPQEVPVEDPKGETPEGGGVRVYLQGHRGKALE